MLSLINKILYIYKINEKQLAKAIGISQRQLIRIKKGESQPGNKFISGLINAFPEVDMNEIIKYLK